MEREDIDNYFVDADDGQIYKMIAYCDQPTVTMERVADKQRIDFCVGSRIARNFVKLVPERRN